jgi:hypothetical protein
VIVEDVTQAAPEPVNVRVDWSEAARVEVQHVNQAMGQVGPATAGVPDGIYLTLASIFPPPIVTPEDHARAMVELKDTGIQAIPAGRFHMSRELAQEVIHVLQFTVAQYDAAVQAARPSGEHGGMPS